jgi:putative nucleotidyltransferase with HDIG domain
LYQLPVGRARGKITPRPAGKRAPIPKHLRKAFSRKWRKLMRRIATSDLLAGQVLTRPVYAPSGELLLPAGTKLTARLRPVLTQWGIAEVCVDEHGQGCPTAPAAPAADRVCLPEPVNLVYCRAVESVAEAMKELRARRAVPLWEVGDHCGELALRIAGEPNLLEYLHLLQCEQEYVFQHSVKVAVLAVLLAKWLGLAFTDQAEVATAAVLHDVGKALVPLEILNKPEPLTPDEFAAVREHAQAGFGLLARECGPPAVVSRVALEHHERMDGSGYPRGLRGRETLLASRVVAVADVYDAMTSNRVYRRGQPEYAVLAHLRESGFSSLDPGVTRTFVERLVYRTLGRLVRLNTGQLGRVVLVDEQEPGRPIVAVENGLIDLRQRRDLSLVC